MKHIKLLKSLIIVTPVLALASPLIILSSTGCGNPDQGKAYLPDGSNWVGRTGGTLNYDIDDENHTYTITSNNNFTADSTFTIPRTVVVDDVNYVTVIGDYAFYGCTGLTEINFGSVTTIGNYAFWGCTGLTEINFGSVTTIGDEAFSGCPLGEISVDSDNSTFRLVGTSTDGFIRKISDSTATLTPVCGTLGGIACGNIIIPAGVTTIDNNAFRGCAGLIGVAFNMVTTIGDYAFRECTGMIGMALNNVTSIGESAFYQCPFQQISAGPYNSVYKLVGTSANGFIRKISDSTATLTPVCGTLGGIACGNIIIPAGVTTIGDYAFRGCEGLTGVDFGGATTIGANAFNGCTGLTEINFGSVTTIGDRAFADCIGLTKANLAIVTSIGTDAFNLCPFNEISVDHANTVYDLEGTSTNGFIKKISDSSTLTPVCGSEGGIACGNITFSGNVTTIGIRAFWGCAGLNGVDFGSVTTIGNYAFYTCRGLTGVDFSSVTTIGTSAFEGCTWLTELDLSSVTTLGMNWCYNCVSLSSVIIGTQTYTSTDNGWDRVGPTNCILYATDESYANTFKANVIGAAYAGKWTYQHI